MLERQHGVVALALFAGVGCALDPIESPEFEADGPEGTILITTTDHATGSISVFDVHTRRVSTDVALGDTDTLPFFHEGLAYFVHRFMIDRIDVRDPEDGWRLLSQHPLETESGNSANAQALCFDVEGRGWLTQYGAPNLRVLDLDTEGLSEVGEVDLAAWADDDGLIEAGICHAHGETLYVFAQRLDQTGPNWPRVDDDVVLVVDSGTLSVSAELSLLGRWAKQVRPSKEEEKEDTLYVLTTGIVALDLGDHTMEWVVEEAAFAIAGIDDPQFGHQLPQSFDIGPEGSFYLAAYTAAFDEVRVYRAKAGGVPEAVIEDGLNAVERTLEVFDDELWFGDATAGASGLRGYDLSVDPPRALSEVALSTGLAPYSMRAISGP